MLEIEKFVLAVRIKLFRSMKTSKLWQSPYRQTFAVAPFYNNLNPRNVSLTSLLKFITENAIVSSKVEVNQQKLKLKGHISLWYKCFGQKHLYYGEKYRSFIGRL